MESKTTLPCHPAQAKLCFVWPVKMTDLLQLQSHLFKDGHDVWPWCITTSLHSTPNKNKHAHRLQWTPPTNLLWNFFPFCNCSLPKSNHILIDARSMIILIIDPLFRSRLQPVRPVRTSPKNKDSFQTRNRKVFSTPESEFPPPVRSCTLQRSNDASSQREGMVSEGDEEQKC